MSDVAVVGLPQRSIGPLATRRIAHRRELAAEIVAGAAGYAALRSEWRRLAALQPDSIVFQTPEILSVWSHYFGEAGETVVLVVRDGMRTVLIWPLVMERRRFVSVVRMAGAPIAQYDDLLLDPDADGQAVLAAALDALRALRPDVLLLERVRAGSALRTALGQTKPICWAEAAPYVDLSQGADAALKAIRPSVARKQRKRVKRLGRSGDVAFAVAHSAAETEAWLAEALRLKRAWLKSTGRLSRAFAKPESGACLAALARRLDGRDGSPRLIASKLSVDGRTAAIEVAFRYRATYHLYLRAFAPEFATYGPGNVLTERMLGWCAANGMTRYDMMAPRSRNKSEWKSNEVAVLDFALATTLVGKLYAGLVLKRIAPAARSAFYALPTRLRSAIAGLAL